MHDIADIDGRFVKVLGRNLQITSGDDTNDGVGAIDDREMVQVFCLARTDSVETGSLLTDDRLLSFARFVRSISDGF